MLLIVIKIVVTSAMVLALSWINERVGPRIAGILAGFPLGIAVSLFFIGVEQGAGFAAEASVSTLGGLGASLAFCCVYWQVSAALARLKAPALLCMAGASLAGFLGFLAVAALIGELPQNRWLLTAVTLALAGLAILLFRGIDPPEAAALPRLRVGPAALLLRAGVATALVLAITTLAGHIGETWAGFLSGFPVTLYPVLLIAHLSYSERAAHGIIKGFPLGIGSLVVCAFAASFLLAPMGVYWGMLAAILIAGLYLAAVDPA